jgi:two-component sensor histidine kinase
MKRMRSFLQSPFFLALPVTILFIFFLPDVFQKYKTEIVERGIIHKKDGFEYFADLNGDGASEQIVLFNNTEGRTSIKILDYNGLIIDHFYFSGEIIYNSSSLVTDIFNSSSQTGIFLMTRSNDSILLHGVCGGRSNKILFRDQFITTLSEQNGKFDYSIVGMYLYDLDRNGTKEIVSGILAGFQVQPRLLYVYDIGSGRIVKTPPMANFQSICDTADLNGDGFPELLASSYAIDNNEGRRELPYDDNSAWLTVYDRNLNFLFPPKQFKGKYIQLSLQSLISAGKPRLVVLYTTLVPGTGLPKLMMFDVSGKFLKERILADKPNETNYNLILSKDFPGRILLISGNGLVQEFDSGLNVVSQKQIKGLTTSSGLRLDIDGDGQQEFFFYGSKGSPFIVTRADFSYPVAISHAFDYERINLSVKMMPGKSTQLFVQGGNKYILCSYGRNPMFYLKYPVFIAVYLLVLGFIMVIRYLQKRVLRQRYDAEKQIAGMQLLLLGNQLDPHFTFNAINSISASLLQDKPEVANNNLLALSHLMRSSVLQSDKLSRTLAEEIDFLQNYLTLLHSRMSGSFQFRIDLGQNVDLECQVPKMITQLFVENAIKHGLKPLNGGGMLIIRVDHENNVVIIEVEDNGIGRKQAGMTGEKGTGKGMEMMYQTIRIINRFNRKKIRLTITDLKDGQLHPSGTLIRITIPAGMKYRFFEKEYK